MNDRSRPLLLLLSGLCAAPALAGPPTLDQTVKAGEKSEKFKLIHVNDLVAMQKKGKVFVFDANTPGTRQKLGMVPGAVQLSSANDYDFKVLPPDKGVPLVFYCANTH